MQYTLKLTNAIQRVPELAEWVEQIAQAAGLPDEKMFQLNLSLEEAVVNVMNYAYPGQEEMPVEIGADILEDRVRFVLVDSGIPFDPTKQEEPDLTLSAEDRPIGGLGIMLIRQFMQDISYEYKDGKNRLTLAMMK